MDSAKYQQMHAHFMESAKKVKLERGCALLQDNDLKSKSQNPSQTSLRDTN